MKIQTFTIVAGTSACNAKCPYCISKMTPKQGICIKEQKINWKNFNKACRLAEMNNVTTVLITGKGEPTLYPEQITDFLTHLKPFNFPLIEIQTNALIFGKEWKEYEKHLKKWNELGLNTIAISIVHYDKKRNKEILTKNQEYIDLPEILDKLHKIGYSIRLSCIMLKDYIDNPKEIEILVKKCKEWKVEQLTIRSVKATKESEDKNVQKFAKNHELTKEQLRKIINYLNKNATKLMTLEHGGVVYDLKDQNICLTDCLTIKPQTEELRQLIFFPDGHLRYDWRYKGAILI